MRTLHLLQILFLHIYLFLPIYLFAQKQSKSPNHLADFSYLKPKAQVMVLGTYHFHQEKMIDELSPENQEEIKKVINQLALFKPHKVFIEKTPSQSEKYNQAYQAYLRGTFTIEQRSNEIFQIGFKMARTLQHQKIFLFDNQTPFTGSLENFTFRKLDSIAELQDKGFYD
ncbi:MAG: DUF5694 domain-containing protein, partial [Bacteroidota bacterium]